MNEIFRQIAKWTSRVAGSPVAFVIAIAVVIIWGVSGPVFGFSDTWQLMINTGTTILTFLMVFLIQNTQNRDAHAVHLKLDELIRATRARNDLIDIEEMDDEQIATYTEEFHTMRNGTQKLVRKPRIRTPKQEAA